MKTDIDSLQHLWNDAKKNRQQTGEPAAQIIPLAAAKKKSSIYAHYGNIAVLAATMLMLLVFFYFLFPFRDTLSHAGVLLMVGSLACRIAIEIFSIRKSRQINVADPAATATGATLQFYKFRKKIHGPVTVVIVALYSLGFFMLSPEWSRYLSTGMMILLDGSYVVGAAILTWQIRKGIIKEMEDLSALAELKAEMESE